MGLWLWNNMLLLGWRDGKRNGKESEVWLIGSGMGVWEMAGTPACMDIPSDKHCKDAQSPMHVRRNDKHTLKRPRLIIKTKFCVLFFRHLQNHISITFSRHQTDLNKGLPRTLTENVWSKLLSINTSSCTRKMSRQPVRLYIPAGFYESNLKCALWLLCLCLFRPFHSKHLTLTEHSNWNTEGLPHIQLVVSCVNDVVCSRIRLFLSLTLSTLI